MPVYRADRESLLRQGDIPCCIGRIALALLDPRQPRREIRGEEQADEAHAVSGCEICDFCPFRFLQIGGIEHDRTALSEDTLRGARKHAIDTLRDIAPIGGFRQGRGFTGAEQVLANDIRADNDRAGRRLDQSREPACEYRFSGPRQSADRHQQRRLGRDEAPRQIEVALGLPPDRVAPSGTVRSS